jgi:hypothetical protein
MFRTKTSQNICSLQTRVSVPVYEALRARAAADGTSIHEIMRAAVASHLGIDKPETSPSPTNTPRRAN